MSASMKDRFDEIEREIMEGKHTAASVFTQMRTAAIYMGQPQPEVVPDGCTIAPCELLECCADIIRQAIINRSGSADWHALVLSRVKKAISAAPAPAGWIPVSERLPEPETDVLVRGVRRNEVMHNVAGVFNGEWSSQETEDLIRGEVTHWMPLPAAPGRQEVK